MLDIIPIILGIILLIRGSFTVLGRQVAGQTGRLIGALLIAPSIFTFCSSAVLAYNAIRVDEGGEMTINVNDVNLEGLITTQLILLAVAFGISAWLIWKSPAAGASPSPPQPTMWGIPPASQPADPFTPPDRARAGSVPSILTVPEAARYLRVSEVEIIRLIEEGHLPAARTGGNNYRIARSAIDDYVNAAPNG
jgi:excisionase family DNA binding protein